MAEVGLRERVQAVGALAAPVAVALDPAPRLGTLASGSAGRCSYVGSVFSFPTFRRLSAPRAFAGHLMSFALARELAAADQMALDHIVQATADDGYKIQTLVKQVILSEPFRNKSNPRSQSTNKLQRK